ncbi:hypothetical protein E2C01_080472 [Portunus trituberculatus]|uniref:Uncharacterized protein n=1 Tax=Portunus trituberculatus TaxID=210409 RepID=A0A5B7IYH3_PORTR|nr:hypothetical protein [Portunus trituberculatus]
MYCGRGYCSATPRHATRSVVLNAAWSALTLAWQSTCLPFFDWSSCQVQPVYLYSLLSTVTLQCVDCNSASSRQLQASFKVPRLQDSGRRLLIKPPRARYQVFCIPTLNTGKLSPGVSFHHTCICRWCGWYQDMNTVRKGGTKKGEKDHIGGIPHLSHLLD